MDKIEIDKIYQGDCLEVLKTFPDECIDCCVTSPPYYSLRDYKTATWEGGSPECDHLKNPEPFSKKAMTKSTISPCGSTGHAQEGYKDVCGKCGAKRVDKQIGLEKTPEQYINKLVEVFREIRRCMKTTGTCWINISDTYAGNCSQASNNGRAGFGNPREKIVNRVYDGIKPKDLIGIPWALAFALRTDGWWLRQDIIWQKLNPMPESVDSRCTKSHEYIFLLAKSQKYYYDNEAIKEDATSTDNSNRNRDETKLNNTPGRTRMAGLKTNHYEKRNKRSVWTVNTKPLKEAHFACVDAQTLCLTKEGWKKYNELKKGELILTYNKQYDKLELTPLNDIFIYDYEGYLIRAESRDISLALTPNHNCIISYPTTANNRTPCWRQKIITAKELKLGDKILSSAEYNKFLEYSIFKDDEIKLWAWILTEGGYDKKWNRICIYQNKGKKAKEIKNILNKLNINYTIYKRKKIFYNGYDRSKGLTFNIKSIDAKKIIKILPNKQMPVGYLYKMTKKQLELFVETLIKGDGHKRKSDGRNMFIQKDSQRTELFEIANVLLGKRVISKKTNYCTNDINHVYLTNHKYTGLRTTNGTSSKIFKEYYNGKVWCPSTSNGSFVAKRNGIIYITGNSFPPNLITPMILAGCPIDGIVLDPFMGSGTTAFTAKRLNRHYVGIELSKEYIKMAEKRIANELGLFAEI